MKEITRRQFGKVAAATAALAGVSLPEFSPHSSFAQQPGGSRQFPPGFVWGCATAAYQIEGGVHEGGRGASIWDVFSHTPGKTYNGDTGDVADDSYHLYKDDVRLLKNLGVRAYRMSIAWSRIFPNGTGQPSQAGLDYYKRVLDELQRTASRPTSRSSTGTCPRRCPEAGNRAPRRWPLPITPATWRGSCQIACAIS
jgi:beta-glucosidase